MLQAVKARRRSPWGSLPAPRTRGTDLASTGARLANVSGVMSGGAEVNRCGVGNTGCVRSHDLRIGGMWGMQGLSEIMSAGAEVNRWGVGSGGRVRGHV